MLWTDSTQFITTMLVWTITVPVGFFIWFGILRDNIRYVCIPIMIATAVFNILVVAMSLWVIIVGLYSASHWWVSLMHAINISVLIFTASITAIYGYFLARKDLLKTDDEEIDQA